MTAMARQHDLISLASPLKSVIRVRLLATVHTMSAKKPIKDEACGSGGPAGVEDEVVKKLRGRPPKKHQPPPEEPREEPPHEEDGESSKEEEEDGESSELEEVPPPVKKPVTGVVRGRGRPTKASSEPEAKKRRLAVLLERRDVLVASIASAEAAKDQIMSDINALID